MDNHRGALRIGLDVCIAVRILNCGIALSECEGFGVLMLLSCAVS